jgi:hypothetical protein
MEMCVARRSWVSKASMCREAIAKGVRTCKGVLNWVEGKYRVRLNYQDAANALFKHRHNGDQPVKRGRPRKNTTISELATSIRIARDFVQKVGGVNKAKDLLNVVETCW